MFDLDTIVSVGGVIGVASIIFAESGFLVGFFLPGDSLLVVAGLFAALGKIDIVALVLSTIFAAVAGDSVGYATGKALGPRVFRREEGIFFKKAHVERARAFFESHGPWAVVLARFMPVIRTFIPIMAGVGTMQYRKFLAYNILGGIIWAGGILVSSYLAGIYIPAFTKYIDYVILTVVVVSFIPLFIHGYREHKRKKRPE